MKKILSLLVALILAASCFAVCASASRPEAFPDKVKDGEELTLYPASMLLPIFSSSSGEKLRVFYEGELIPGNLFSWSSSDTSVVRVDQTGALTAVAPGTAVITVTDDDLTAESIITVVSDDDFARLADLEATEIDLPFYSETVGIGPLCGAQPVILKRFINPPSCGGNQPDPNDLIVSEGWTYSFAVVYKFSVHNQQTICFISSPSTAEGDHAANAYLAVYDPYFFLWNYSKGSAANPFGSLSVTFYEENYFYLVVTPINHTDDTNSGNICLYVYDNEMPYAYGDVNRDHSVTSTDALLTLRAAMGMIELDSAQQFLADLSGNGLVETDDALLILREVLHLYNSTEH